MKQYIYIDDSGDPGLGKTSSSNFIIAAVIVVGQENRDELEQAIINYRKGLGWGEKEELKFHKSHKDAIRLAIKAVSKYEYSAYAIILEKNRPELKHRSSSNTVPTIVYVIKELLRNLAIADGSEIIIDGSYGPKFVKQTRPYLRKNLSTNNAAECRIRFSDSKNSPLIQLADLVAGSVARSLTTKTDARDYLRLFGKKIKRIYRL